MHCDQVRRHWNLYYDSEGDAELHFQINAHLSLCPGCTNWFRKQARFEDALRERLNGDDASPLLWQRALARAGAQPRAKRRIVLFSTAGALAAGVLLALAFWLLRPATADLARLGADWHGKLLDGTRQVAHPSRSDPEVEAYLRRLVAFPVRCPPRKDAGFSVRGAGVCTLAGSQAAYLLGEVEATPVSILILARDSLDRFPHQRDALRRVPTHQCRDGKYQMVLGTVDQNLVLVIGEAHPDSLLKVLRAYGSYPHQDDNRA